MKDVIRLISIFILLYLIFRSVGVVMSQVKADYHHKRSVILFNNASFEEAYAHSVKSIMINSNEPEYLVQKAKTVIGLLSMEDENKRGFKEEALQDIDKAISLNEKNLVVKRNVIPLYYFLSLSNVEKEKTENELDVDILDIAKSYYQRLIDEYPNDVGLIAQIAIYQKKLGLSKDLSSSLSKISDLRPDLLDWYLPQ